MKSFFSRLLGSVVLVSAATGVFSQAPSKDIYPAGTVAPNELKDALAKAAKSHKKIILDFGGNWCGDCRALNTLFHKEPNASLLKANFILVDVNIGKMDMNVDIAKKYEVPLDKGVPALAVLDSKGELVYSQKNGEFEAMRRMNPQSVTEFLNKWK